MRLIDADSLIERLRKDPLHPVVNNEYGIEDAINYEPTVDPRYACGSELLRRIEQLEEAVADLIVRGEDDD